MLASIGQNDYRIILKNGEAFALEMRGLLYRIAGTYIGYGGRAAEPLLPNACGYSLLAVQFSNTEYVSTPFSIVNTPAEGLASP